MKTICNLVCERSVLFNTVCSIFIRINKYLIEVLSSWLQYQKRSRVSLSVLFSEMIPWLSQLEVQQYFWAQDSHNGKSLRALNSTDMHIRYKLKMDFSNLVGKPGSEAEKVIKQHLPDAQVEILPDGSPVTRDFRPSRYRVFVDANGNVASAPTAG